MPLFSVIVPTYNTKKYLRQCINSVLSQKYQNFEIILVNDCSTDGSGKICEGYKKNKKVKIIHNKKNCGAGLSRNKGISVSTGKYILFLDSDDYLYQGCFTGLEKLIRKNNNIDVIITKFLAEQPPYSNDYLFKKDFSKSNNTDKFISHINKINYQANVCWHYIIKKNLIVKNKLKFVDAKLNEDQEFVTRLLCLMRSFALYKGRYYWHRERPGSLNRSIDLKTTKSFLLVFNELSQCFRVMYTPGHTDSDVTYIMNEQHMFCGDLIFSAGCGKVFGAYEDMYKSLVARADVLAPHHGPSEILNVHGPLDTIKKNIDMTMLDAEHIKKSLDAEV